MSLDKGDLGFNPHFSRVSYCDGESIRSDCVTLRRPPRRTVQVRLRRPRSQALSERRLHRLVTKILEKCGLRELEQVGLKSRRVENSESSRIDEFVLFIKSLLNYGTALTPGSELARALTAIHAPGPSGNHV
jgi:hypothetical protein